MLELLRMGEMSAAELRYQAALAMMADGRCSSCAKQGGIGVRRPWFAAVTHTFWIDDKSTARVARGAELDAEGPHQPEKREKQRTGSGPDHDHARNDPCSPSNRGARLGNRHPQIE